MISSQEVHLQALDHENVYKLESDLINIYASTGSALDCQTVMASSKIKMQPAVKFHWEYHYRLQRLLCRHRFSPLVAYCIFNNGPQPDSEKIPTMVRLRYADTAKKCLLKNFFGRVITMDFALSLVPVLAVLDDSPTLHVFKMDINGGNDHEITAMTLFLLRLDHSLVKPDLHMLSWCPWESGCRRAVPLSLRFDGQDYRLPEDPSMLLAVSRDKKVMMMDIASLPGRLQHYSSEGHTITKPSLHSENISIWTFQDLFNVLVLDEDSNSFFTMTEDHPANVTALQISPDSSCLASACMDGNVRLFSIRSFANRSPNGNLVPIRVFSPHDGLPIHGLLFLDSTDPQNDGKSSTWSHLITGSQYNREICLWCCSTWDCLQTIRFHPADKQSSDRMAVDSAPKASSNPKPHLLIGLDWSKRLLVVTDITRRVLYILSLSIPPTGALRFSSISEFLLTNPCVTFAVGDCERKTLNDSDLHNVPIDLINLEVHSVHTLCLINNLITFELPHWSPSALEETTGEKDQIKSNLECDESFCTVISREDVENNCPIEETSSPAHEIPTPDFPEQSKIGNDNEDEIMAMNELTVEPLVMNDVENQEVCLVEGEDGNSEDEEEDFEHISPLRPSDFSSKPCPPFPDEADEAGDRILDEEFDQDLEHSSFPTPTRLVETPVLNDEIEYNLLLHPTDNSLEGIVHETAMEKPFDQPDPLPGHDGVLLPIGCSSENQRMEPSNQSPTPNIAIPAELDAVDRIPNSTFLAVLPESTVPPVKSWSTMSVYSSSSSSRRASDGAIDEPIEDKADSVGTHSPEDEDRCPDAPDTLHHLTALLSTMVEQSKSRDERIEQAVVQLNDTQEQLQAIQRFQTDLVQRLETDYPPPALTSIRVDQSADTRPGEFDTVEPDGSGTRKVPKWFNDILLQLRGQQGEFNRRFNKLEATVNKLLSASQQQKHPQQPKNLVTVDSLRPVIRAELQNAFTKNVPRFVEPVQKVVTQSVRDSLGSLCANLPDEVSRVLRDKNFTTQIARNLSSNLASDLGAAYRDSLQSAFVPALERTVSRLFDELHIIFRAGTQQYLEKLSQIAQTSINTTTVANAVCSQILPAIQNRKPAAPSNQNAGVNNMKHNLGTPELPSSPRRDTMKQQPIQALRQPPLYEPKLTSQQPIVSAPNKSSWTVDRGAQGSANANKQKSVPTDNKLEFSHLLDQAQTLIRERRYVAALELALVSTNQPLVLEVCRDIDPRVLFLTNDHPMGQNVLLSLIHQLTCGDLGAQIDLKINYLQGAIQKLDLSDRTTIEHGPVIITLLFNRLETFLKKSTSTSRQLNARKLSSYVQMQINQLIQSAKCLKFSA